MTLFDLSNRHEFSTNMENSENTPVADKENNVLIKAGAKFDSFRRFEAAFEDWKLQHWHPFRVASSETLRMPDGTTNEVFKYRYIVYHCAHYGSPRMRGMNILNC